MGGSASGSKSKSKGSMGSQESVWGPQGGALQGLYEQAAQLFGNKGSMYGGKMDSAAGNLTPYNQQIMDRAAESQRNLMGGGVYGNGDEIRSGLMDQMNRQNANGSQMGQMYNSIVGGQGNTYIDPMVDRMNRSNQQQVDTMQSQNALGAAAAGQGGSSRQAMQNAMQGAQMENNRMDREMSMRQGAYDTDLQMKMGIAGMADQNSQLNSDRMMQMLGGSNANMQSAAGMGSGMQNLGMGSMAPWQQAQRSGWEGMGDFASIIGAPTVLGSSSGRQSGSSKGTSGGGSVKG